MDATIQPANLQLSPQVSPSAAAIVQSPAETIRQYTEIARVVSDAIARNGWAIDLAAREGGRPSRYVVIEGWQMIAALVGATTQIESVRRETDGDVIVYHATAIVVRLADGAVIGRGQGMCRGDEEIYSRKQGRMIRRWQDEFAIKAMSQTRAAARAMRVAFGWLVKLAGFEATPAEEMPPSDSQSEPAVVVKTPPSTTPSKTPPPKREGAIGVKQPDPADDARQRGMNALHALMSEVGVDVRDRSCVHAIASHVLNREIGSLNDCSVEELRVIYSWIRANPNAARNLKPVQQQPAPQTTLVYTPPNALLTHPAWTTVQRWIMAAGEDLESAIANACREAGVSEITDANASVVIEWLFSYYQPIENRL